MKREYKPLQALTGEEINQILQSGTIEELMLLPLSVGEYHSNWKESQDICVKLASYNEEKVRANACLGLAYIARTKGKLEKHIVKPILLKQLDECTEYRWRIIDSIEDINIFMGWHIGEQEINRIEIQ